MIIAIKGVTGIYARAALRQLKAPTLEIRSSSPGEVPTYDWIISASEHYSIDYMNPKITDIDRGKAVVITVEYSETGTSTAYLSEDSYEYITIFRGDRYTKKEE